MSFEGVEEGIEGYPYGFVGGLLFGERHGGRAKFYGFIEGIEDLFCSFFEFVGGFFLVESVDEHGDGGDDSSEVVINF